MRSIALAVLLLALATPARAAECDSPDPPGPFAVRMGENTGDLFYAMMWRSRPPAPRAVSLPCLPGGAEAAPRRTSDNQDEAPPNPAPARTLRRG